MITVIARRLLAAPRDSRYMKHDRLLLFAHDPSTVVFVVASCSQLLPVDAFSDPFQALIQSRKHVLLPCTAAIVERLPLWLAPNLITLTGFIAVVIAYVLSIWYVRTSKSVDLWGTDKVTILHAGTHQTLQRCGTCGSSVQLSCR